METIDIKDAQVRLAELIESLAENGDVVITREQRPVARLTPADRPSLRDFKPVSLGAPLGALERDDDLRDEMLRS